MASQPAIVPGMVPEYDEATGKYICLQLTCKNNKQGYCKLEKPDFSIFEIDVWGCSDERYPSDRRAE